MKQFPKIMRILLSSVMSDLDPILKSDDFEIDFQDFSNTMLSIPDDTPTIPSSVPSRSDEYDGE